MKNLSLLNKRLNKINENENLRLLALQLVQLVKDSNKGLNAKDIDKLIKKFSVGKVSCYTRDQIIVSLRNMASYGEISSEDAEYCIKTLKLKPTRSISGVTTVTVLTKPYACPGRCIFCPNDIRMPKSYIATEPGAQRALVNRFSPYLQVFNRLMALFNIGHPVSKIELLVLGGTWASYPNKYKVWFIYECFKALNDFGRLLEDGYLSTYQAQINNQIENNPLLKFLFNPSVDINAEIRKITNKKYYNQLLQTNEYISLFSEHVIDESEKFDTDELWLKLDEQHTKNEISKVRCVGLVLETRPDTINQKEVYNMRKLGATKVQIGFQCTDDEINKLNKRGETVEQIYNAFYLLRAGGFKIHGHFMPNLYGSNIEKDIEMYKEIFNSPNLKPDELKIYPTSVIKDTELYEKFLKGEYRTYSKEELQYLISELILLTPEYCRLTRIIRDIPSTEIEAGNKTTNLRQISEEIAQKKGEDKNIRAREIKDEKLEPGSVFLKSLEYDTSFSKEVFLQFVTKKNKLAGFLRLSLPKFTKNPISSDLDNVAMIRELHVYGPVVDIGDFSEGNAQHLGLGNKLLTSAFEISRSAGFKKIAVISAVGTRQYYLKRGFENTKPWMIKNL